MRVATPCSENLDAMPRNAEGDPLCSKCDRVVADLRRVPRKRALAVISALRRQGDGSVCVRVRATRDGTPVFAPDPSPFARFVGPIALVGSLAACSPQGLAAAPGTTPVSVVDTTPGHDNANGQAGTHATPVVSTTQPVPGRAQNVSYPPPDIADVAGGLAFSGP